MSTFIVEAVLEGALPAHVCSVFVYLDIWILHV